MVYGTTAEFAPYLREEDNERAELAEMAMLGGYSVMTSGSPAALAVAWFSSRGGFPNPLKGSLQWLMARRTERVINASTVENTGDAQPGILSVSSDDLPDLIAEVQRFKWIEAERQGRDIWMEMNPADPDKPAIEEWCRRYFTQWRAGNRHPHRTTAA